MVWVRVWTARIDFVDASDTRSIAQFIFSTNSLNVILHSIGHGKVTYRNHKFIDIKKMIYKRLNWVNV